ncbi:hypothetical protein IWX84_002637 [Flavobacterium sp. CG_9.10]|uniref:hypothetical protein n=1 Tax=Flavobacterium sp. CG_9.10 TaxID=2787729 RepID=UPI0018CB0869|nr:hypothetical protein [Flavobacterium sp. CG_9.10]MBG6111749.1 hypothetical protein [Flavobacterium sp. CG_9.10]
MKLTTVQITQIEETLVLNGLKYDDIKLEVTDHIASEIEFLMEENTLSFNENLKIVFGKWKPQLKSTTYGLLLGYAYSGPKIAMEKMADFSKSELKWGFVLSIFSASIIVIINKIFNNINFLLMLGIIVKTLLFAITLLIIYYRVILSKSNWRTTYSVMFKRRIYLTLAHSISIWSGIFPIVPLNKSSEVKIFSLIIPLILILYGLNSLRFLHKHFQIEKKLSISNS